MSKRLPKLKTDRDVEKFLDQDLSDYIHTENFSPAFFEYAPKSKTISLRLSQALLDAIKKISKRQKIPYQRFIRHALEQSIRKATSG